MVRSRRAIVLMCALLLPALSPAQQTVTETDEPSVASTHLIRFSGVVRDAAGRPQSGNASVTFSIYADAEGTQLLWSETQNVRGDRQGRYSVLLGAESGGVPVELFAGESARWLGVRMPDGRESKTLLVSVPYALKAAFATEAETLGGRSAAAFITKEELSSGQIVLASGNIVPLATSGTAGKIGKFTSATDLGDSSITEFSGTAACTVGSPCIGIGIDTPERTLHVKGASGAMLFDAGNLATNPVLFFAHDNFASKFRNRIMLDRTNESMQIWSQNGPRLFVVGDRVGINVSNPSQALDVAGAVRAAGGIVFGDGTLQTTANVGGGGGDITSVSPGSGLTGGGTSGDVTLSVDSSVARTTAPNAFAGNQTITGNLTMNGSITLNVGLCPGVACKQLVLGGYTPIGGSTPGIRPQAGEAFGLNVLGQSGEPVLLMDTTANAGTAIQQAIQAGFGTQFDINAPAALRGDAVANCTSLPTPGQTCAAYGVIGTSRTGQHAIGVLGWSEQGYGVYGVTDSSNIEVAVTGFASSTTGSGYGLWGNVRSPNATAGLFTVSSTAPGTLIQAGRLNSSTGILTPVFTVLGSGNASISGNLSVGGVLSGDGSGLTGVATSGLAAGTYGNAYTFSNSGNSFTGSGSGLSNVTASGLGAGTYANQYTFSNTSNVYFGDGSNLTGIGITGGDADTLGGVDAANYARRDVGNTLNGNQSIVGTVSVSPTAGGAVNIVTASENSITPALTVSRVAGTVDHDLMISKTTNSSTTGISIQNTGTGSTSLIRLQTSANDGLNSWSIGAVANVDNTTYGLRINNGNGEVVSLKSNGNSFNMRLSGNLDLPYPSIPSYGNITIDGSRFLHARNGTFLGINAGNHTMTSSFNVGVGEDALRFNSSGPENTAIGYKALRSNTTGTANTAVGSSALSNGTIGTGNVAIGQRALGDSVNEGNYNVAVGPFALLGHTTGDDNIAIGRSALQTHTTGSNNVVIGVLAASGWSSVSNNIIIGANVGNSVTGGDSNIYLGGQPTSNENSTVRIGSTQTRYFAAGIRGVTTANNDAVNVLIDSSGQLGTVSSSARVKFDIAPMAAASRRVLDLRPVTFRYRQPYADGSQPVQFGLIAEEVAQVFPELAARNSAGEIETVKYHLLPVLLLNEVQRQQAELTAKDAVIAQQNQRISDLEARLAAIEKALAGSR